MYRTKSYNFTTGTVFADLILIAPNTERSILNGSTSRKLDILLRRITRHVSQQNWTAVAIDFVIVVVGVFIGIQVSNSNEARGERKQELAVLTQLSIEYADIASALERQIFIREGYVESLAALVAGLENENLMPEPVMIKRALMAARSTGRPPAKSAAYMQLSAAGQLNLLSDGRLKNRLVQYHALVEREAFLFLELTRTSKQEFFANSAVDFDINGLAIIGAAVDAQDYSPVTNAAAIRSYDVDKLDERLGQYEWQLMVNKSLVRVDQRQLGLVQEIQADIEANLAQ